MITRILVLTAFAAFVLVGMGVASAAEPRTHDTICVVPVGPGGKPLTEVCVVDPR